MSKQFTTPHEIAQAGQQIYDLKFKAAYEQSYAGQFAAIDVTTDKAFVDPTPEGVLAKAKVGSPTGVFHLIKIGSPGAFRVSYTSYGRDNWLTQ